MEHDRNIIWDAAVSPEWEWEYDVIVNPYFHGGVHNVGFN